MTRRTRRGPAAAAAVVALGTAASRALAQAPARWRLAEVARFPSTEPVGVAASPTGRVFLTFPYSDYSDSTHATSVAELRPGGAVRPYPDAGWNAKPGPGQGWAAVAPARFVNVQGVTVDAAGRLWLLDTGSPKRSGVVPGGAKLVEVDLAADRVRRVVPVPDAVATRESFLNDVRVDARRQVAYLSETGAVAGLAVVDLRSGAARRIDAEHLPSRTARAEGPTGVRGGWGFPDGVALDAAGDTLYFQTLSGPGVYAVPTATLRAFVAGRLTPAEAGARARQVSRAAPVDGIARGPDGRLYAWDVAGRRLVRYRPGRDGVETLFGDSSAFFRPDGIDVARDGTVYFTDPQFRRSAAADSTVRPFRVYRLAPPRPEREAPPGTHPAAAGVSPTPEAEIDT